jgi:curved DNA-binding protein CbpA
MANNYYAVLGVSKNATMDEIKKAYRFLAQQLHPDKHQGKNAQIAEKKLKELNEAYETLGDAQKRAAYDKSGGNTGNESGGFKKSGDPSRDEFLGRIELYVKLREWETAITQSGKYLTKYPGDIDCYFFRAMAYCAKGDGIPRFTSLNETTFQLLSDAGECYNNARDDYGRILALDPDNAAAFAGWGYTHECRADLIIKGTTQEMNEAMDKNMAGATGFTMNELRMHELYEAVSAFRKAVRLDPHNADYRANLQRLEEKFQQAENAIKKTKNVIKQTKNTVKTENKVNSAMGITGAIIKLLPTILGIAGIVWLISKCG